MKRNLWNWKDLKWYVMNKNNLQISASGSERPYARTVCKTCMHHCNLAPGQSGICGARKNENGTIVCVNYGKITALALDLVLALIRRAAQTCHVELTTLIVPGENDDPAQMEELAKWAGPDIPLHVTRFFPRYHMTEKDATDVQQVYRLANLAGKYVKHVFVGNC